MIISCKNGFMISKKPETPPITVAFLLAQVGGRAAQEFAKALSPLGLAPPDAGILRLLSLSPGISQQELARRLGMHASRLVAVIDAMEERGLVVREANLSDRRLYSLQLSEAGRAAVNATARVAREHEERFCASLSETERGQLRGLLEKLALKHGLARGVHPGYRTLRSSSTKSCPPGQSGSSKRAPSG
jgi:DNA-binding MarR family transcriptional regulator